MDRAIPRDTIQRVGIGGKSVCGALGDNQPCLGVEVLDNVASLMVTLVICNASLASPPTSRVSITI